MKSKRDSEEGRRESGGRGLIGEMEGGREGGMEGGRAKGREGACFHHLQRNWK